MRLKFFGLILLALMVCGCGSTTAKNVEVEKPAVDPIEEMLKNMTLAEKIGQMVMIGVHGTAVDADSSFMLTQYHIGGVIFFDRNMDSREQVKKFAADLNRTAAEKVPLFIALDEEGGRVSRMKHALTPPPSQAEIGSTGNPNNARTYANLTGQELKKIGVNVNFAPVADVGGNDTRSYGDDGNYVADFVMSAAAGYEDAGIFYCLKHFPGIGLGKVDSHVEVSTIDASREILDSIDLVPFRKTIIARDNSRFMVMVGHLRYSAIDAENSASLSPAVMKILRDELGFSGVIITDDLEMGAIANHSDFKNVGVTAIKAGADIALVCHEYEHETAVYLGILDAVERGEISEARIDESVRRILKMKLALS